MGACRSGTQPESDWDSIGEHHRARRNGPEFARSLRDRRGNASAASVFVGDSGVAEVVQSPVVDAEVVRDLVYDGDPNLVDQLVRRLAHPGQRTAEDEDPVGFTEGVAVSYTHLRAHETDSYL